MKIEDYSRNIEHTDDQQLLLQNYIPEFGVCEYVSVI